MRRAWLWGIAAVVACGADSTPGTRAADQAPLRFEPPVLTNAESPVRYPPTLYERRVEGSVVLRIYVEAAGQLVPESTRIAEASGHAGLDSAAVEAVRRMRFAPARRDGRAVATSLLQPIHFRHPGGGAPGGGE